MSNLLLERIPNYYQIGYSNYKKDPTPRIIPLGVWKHPKTEKTVIGSININKMDIRELERFIEYFDEIRLGKNLKQRYLLGKKFVPDLFKKYYRTYDIKHIKNLIKFKNKLVPKAKKKIDKLEKPKTQPEIATDKDEEFFEPDRLDAKSKLDIDTKSDIDAKLDKELPEPKQKPETDVDDELDSIIVGNQQDDDWEEEQIDQEYDQDFDELIDKLVPNPDKTEYIEDHKILDRNLIVLNEQTGQAISDDLRSPIEIIINAGWELKHSKIITNDNVYEPQLWLSK